MRSTEFDRLEGIYEDLNFYEIIKLLLASDIFSLRSFICLEEHTVCS